MIAGWVAIKIAGQVGIKIVGILTDQNVMKYFMSARARNRQ